MKHRGNRVGRRAGLLLVAIAMSGCIIESSPGVDVSPIREPLDLGPDVSRVERILQVTFPPDAFDGAVESGAELRVTTSASGRAPFVPVEFDLGDPFRTAILIEEVSATEGYPLEWEIPRECDSGCVVKVPVTIRETEEGGDTTVSWTIRFWYHTDGPPAVDRDDITAVIMDPEAADEDG